MCNCALCDDIDAINAAVVLAEDVELGVKKLSGFTEDELKALIGGLLIAKNYVQDAVVAEGSRRKVGSRL